MRFDDFDCRHKISSKKNLRKFKKITLSEFRCQTYLRQEENYCTNNLGRGPICDLPTVVIEITKDILQRLYPYLDVKNVAVLSEVAWQIKGKHRWFEYVFC